MTKEQYDKAGPIFKNIKELEELLSDLKLEDTSIVFRISTEHRINSIGNYIMKEANRPVIEKEEIGQFVKQLLILNTKIELANLKNILREI